MDDSSKYVTVKPCNLQLIVACSVQVVHGVGVSLHYCGNSRGGSWLNIRCLAATVLAALHEDLLSSEGE